MLQLMKLQLSCLYYKARIIFLNIQRLKIIQRSDRSRHASRHTVVTGVRYDKVNMMAN